jgi:FtsP/CotA-like multicopper oxidase with cupredoxin domain
MLTTTSLLFVAAFLYWGSEPSRAETKGTVQSPAADQAAQSDGSVAAGQSKMRSLTNQMRREAAQRAAARRIEADAQNKQAKAGQPAANSKQMAKSASQIALTATAMPMAAASTVVPGGTPNYFGPEPNWANSPMPTGAVANTVTMTNGGSGYNAATTTVAITDAYNTLGAGGAVASATVTAGVVTAITVANGGSGYTAPVVTIVDSTIPGGIGATAVASIDGATIAVGTGLRKFMDPLPGLVPDPLNPTAPYIPVAIKDTSTYTGSDYYQLGIFDYTQKMHTDLPATKLRGYRDLAIGADGNNHYLGPIIIAQRDVPVRVKFTNGLAAGAAGNLPIPVDTTVMGAGMGPLGMSAVPMNYTQNRSVIHLHGGATPWISDGTPHQWITPSTETSPYKKGATFHNVPDMVGPGKSIPVPSDNDGLATYYYTNHQSGRMMFYHDHSYGTTRLNVYAGVAAGFLLWDQVEEDLISGTNKSGSNPTLAKVIPDLGALSGHPEYHFGVPLIIQDKTFVDAKTIVGQDPTWNWGSQPSVGGVVPPHTGDLWFSHVYMPNQNPADPMGANNYGRWDYGPWFWPPLTTAAGLVHGEVTLPDGTVIPGTPNPSLTPESFMDTPVVNGMAYPYLTVARTAYRFRILNASNDRTLNLQLYRANPTVATVDGRTNTEVGMLPAIPHSLTVPAADGLLLAAATAPVNPVTALPVGVWPLSWPTDGRDGGVPDPTAAGPAIIQIGSEGGMLPLPVVIPSTPIGYEYNRRNIVVLNVSNHGLLLMPAERADVIIDFSQLPDGAALILYNDAPAPVPAFDSRLDYYTGDPDQSNAGNPQHGGQTGGAPTTQPGFGPNTRTIMQFRVSGATASPAYNLAALQTALPIAYAASQPPPIIPETTYPAPNKAAKDTYARIQDNFLTFAPTGNPLGGVTLTANGRNYTSAPTVAITGGGGTGAAATTTVAVGVNSLTLTRGGTGYLATTSVVFTGGGGTGAAATATIVGGVVTGITLTNPGSGYSSAPTVSFSDGGSGVGASATATISGIVNSITLTNGGTGYTSVPAVALNGGGGTGAAATASLTTTMPLQPKCIQELFELNYGRMNATLGVELPYTNFNIQTTIPLGYIDPVTELLQNGVTQLWKVTHNGVDSHAIHFHLFNVQVINRVGWDGMIRAPDPQEIGWKETVRMNPLEDCIVALTPNLPPAPFAVPNSVRLLDPTMPLDSPLTLTNPADGNPITVANAPTDFGWEYVWHCHILGHEENDMMRPMVARALLAINTTALPAGEVSAPYSQAVIATGGTLTYAWSISAGALPSGLTIDPFTGIISGTPTATGLSSFTVQVTDSSVPAQVATKALSINVIAGPTITTTSLPNGEVSIAYNQPVTATGGITPYAWSVTAGSLPPGLTQNPTTGAISGTPTTAGAYSFTVRITDAVGGFATKAFSITIAALPVITTTSLPNGEVALAYNRPVTVTGGTTPFAWSVSVGSLPPGLSQSPTTGTISGTPTTAGPYSFTVSLTDAFGAIAAKALSITIVTAPVITTTSVPNGEVAVAYSQPVTATGGATPYAWSVSVGSLPPGLSQSPTTGTISGTPTTAGAYPFTVRVTDALGGIATKALSITVAPQLLITTTTLPNGQIGVAYAQTIAATGGVTPYVWSMTGTLPAGLTFNTTTHAITGTPTTAGVSNVTISVTDAMSVVVSKPFSITITASTLTITTTALANGEITVPYSQTLAATGGTLPYTWSLSAGTLPAGLALNAASGVISGTPTVAGTSNFTVRVTSANALTATKPLSIVVVGLPSISTTTLPNGEVSLAYNRTLAVTGGLAPYTWSRTAGVMPAGLVLNSNGTITGTPTTAGTSNFTARVTDAAGKFATRAFTITVVAKISIITPSLRAGFVGLFYTTTLVTNGGVAPFTWSISVGALPAGLTLNSTSGVISGSPTVRGTFAFTVRATDSLGAIATQPLTLTVN